MRSVLIAFLKFSLSWWGKRIFLEVFKIFLSLREPDFVKNLEFKYNLRTAAKKLHFSRTFQAPKNSWTIQEIKDFKSHWPPRGWKQEVLTPKTWKKWILEIWKELTHQSPHQMGKSRWTLVIIHACCRSSPPTVFLGKGVLKIWSRRTPMPKCDFNKVFNKVDCNFIEIALRYGFSPVNLLRIFRTPFPMNTSEGLLLMLVLEYWRC